jgi:hypothetical protein
MSLSAFKQSATVSAAQASVRNEKLGPGNVLRMPARGRALYPTKKQSQTDRLYDQISRDQSKMAQNYEEQYARAPRATNRSLQQPKAERRPVMDHVNEDKLSQELRLRQQRSSVNSQFNVRSKSVTLKRARDSAKVGLPFRSQVASFSRTGQ